MSKAILDTDASRSRASPSRTRKPCLVAFPMAAMMAVGVASTRAQGQNTTRMVTARMISPVISQVERGCGQSDDHDPGGPPVRQPDDLRLARVGGLHQPDHPLDGAVLPTFAARISKEPNWLTVPLDTSSPALLVHRQGFSGHHRLIDGGLARRGSPRPPGPFPRQHAEQVAHRKPAPPGSTASWPSSNHSGRRAGVRCTSFSMPARAFATVRSSSRRAQLHDERDLTRGKIFPNEHRGDQCQWTPARPP